MESVVRFVRFWYNIHAIIECSAEKFGSDQSMCLCLTRSTVTLRAAKCVTNDSLGVMLSFSSSWGCKPAHSQPCSCNPLPRVVQPCKYSFWLLEAMQNEMQIIICITQATGLEIASAYFST